MGGITVWCGYAAKNFGNFIAEYASRLLASKLRYPEEKFLFLLPTGVGATDLSPWFWQVLDWVGIKKNQVIFCGSEPLIIENLRVFPQSEYMGRGGAPSSEYLDLLDELAVSNGLEFGGGGMVYVSRAGMGSGSLGGELYLESMLKKVGVKTIRPEKLSIREQLHWYAKADTLIFAEGSAVHGRQLLGRRQGREVILVRRKGQIFAGRSLEPRCRDLMYLDALNASVYFNFDPISKLPTPFSAFPFMNDSLVVDKFNQLGIDLSSVWDRGDFKMQLEKDLYEWAKEVCGRESLDNIHERIKLMQGSLYSSGLQFYVSGLTEIAKRFHRG